MARLRVALVNQYHGYEDGLLYRVLQSLPAITPEIGGVDEADLVIQGPYPPPATTASLPERLWQRGLAAAGLRLRRPKTRHQPVVLYHTWENTRSDWVAADFAMSSDLGVTDATHCRFPVWMGSIDWSHEGIASKPVPRFGEPIPIDVLCAPIGNSTARPRRAFIVTSHLRQPRRALFDAVRTVMEVDGYGPAFDSSITHHGASGFDKRDISRAYRYSLCPENSMYPGYYTEKVVEAFACGCIPLAWCDGNVVHDFNPSALLNLAEYAAEGYADGLSRELTEEREYVLTQSPLLRTRPTLEPVRNLLMRVAEAALRPRHRFRAAHTGPSDDRSQ